ADHRHLGGAQPALADLTELGQEQLPGEAVRLGPGQRWAGFDQRWEGHVSTLTRRSLAGAVREVVGGGGLVWTLRWRAWRCGCTMDRVRSRDVQNRAPAQEYPGGERYEHDR